MSEAPVSEYDYDASPRAREWARQRDLEADPEGTTTTYEKVSVDTEKVTWTNAKGEGFSWTQTWPCPLDEAPQIGDNYRILHDEWWVEAGGEGESSRYIHEYEIVAPVAAGAAPLEQPHE